MQKKSKVLEINNQEILNCADAIQDDMYRRLDSEINLPAGRQVQHDKKVKLVSKAT